MNCGRFGCSEWPH